MAKLTEAIIRKALPQDKPYRLTDEFGLFLHVAVAGSKTWRLRFRKGGKDTAITLGTYPAMGLKDAREATRSILYENDGNAPAKGVKAPTLRTVAEEWIQRKKTDLAPVSMDAMMRSLALNVYPALGDMPINEITPLVILNVLRVIEDRGATSVSRNVYSYIGQIMRYAVACQYIPSDPSRDIADALQRHKGGHFEGATTRENAARVVKAVRDLNCTPTVKLALEFLMLTFVRPHNVRNANWDQFDLENRVWHIPAEGMKMRVAHDVPLSDQAMKVLEVAKMFSRDGIVFYSFHSNGGSISASSLNAALKDGGLKETAHGFRTMASSLLNEAGEDPDVIEKALAHKGVGVRAVYNRTDYWQKRVDLMQKWADMVDELGK